MNKKMIKKWLERVENLLQVSKDLQLNLVATNFSRSELVELRMMLETLQEMGK